MHLDFNGTWELIIDKDGVKLELSTDESLKILDSLIQDFCPFCQSGISQKQKICCDCLASIYSYHQKNHACQS